MKINPAPPKDWQDLQNQAAQILTECGLTAEVEKAVKLARGDVNVDVYGLDTNQTPKTVCLCECKNWSTAVPKDVVHGFRTVMGDFGANLGYVISSGGFQKGAPEAAEFTNIKLV